MFGKMSSNMGLGINSDGQYDANFERTLSVFVPPGFKIAKIVSLGMVMSMGASIDMTGQGSGQQFYSSSGQTDSYSIRLDLVDNSQSSATWQTDYTPSILAAGQMSGSGTFSLPFTFAVTVDLPAIGWRNAVSITNEPGITGSIEYSTQSDDPSQCPNGFAYNLTLANAVSGSFSGGDPMQLSEEQGPSKSGCYQ